MKRVSRVPNRLPQKQLTDSYPHSLKGNKDQKDSNKLLFKASSNGQNRLQKPKMATSTTKSLNNKKEKFMTSPSRPPGLFEGSDEQTVEEVNEFDALDEPLSCDESIATDVKTGDPGEISQGDGQVNVYRKVEMMEYRIKKLEEELREVAALEISLYSVVPEHGNSAHKVHAPARRLSRLYIHACEHWAPDNRATVARNIVSGLVVIAKSCGDDVSSLFLKLSAACLNQIQVRRLLVQMMEQETRKKFSPLKLKDSDFSKQTKRPDLVQLADDWKETSTFISALEKIESWIFSRAVESVWWQSFNLHTPVECFSTTNRFQISLETALDDQHEGNSYTNIWKDVFHDAFARICPVRAGGLNCGCLLMLAKMIMKQCICRLDVAMFNAILHKDFKKVPIDPASDPIDVKFLPIPDGNLSFGLGIQLKSSIGIWSRILTNLCGMDVEGSYTANQKGANERTEKPKSFCLLNELSDLLMLPKDNLLNNTTRKEICKSLGLSAVKRVLYNFTPDEFLPDPAPSGVLEELNRECLLKSIKKDQIPFPHPAAPVVYSPPSSTDVKEAVTEARSRGKLERNGSLVKWMGYASDEDMYDIDSSFTSIILETPVSAPSGVETQNKDTGMNVRYKLLHKGWSK
ncbi:hypothetical protein J5N97_000058 [Dioscorea zingiberensis]|uniref:Uncharacterized protein n=1 Tax=Dioscorea zingiberensis TaxID=325984 RepID=A0A9D5BVM2_9LILI|nr:hypothetical protein J5N97_000058 [Dioscorea zingiberensis]